MVDGYEFVDLNLVKPDPDAIALAPGDFAMKNKVLPLGFDGESLVVAMGSPQSLGSVDDLGILLQRPVTPVLADANLIDNKIQEFFLEKILSGLATSDEAGAAEVDESTDLADLLRMADDSAVVKMVNAIFAQAARDGASDIHIEPYEREVKIRYRIDGMLHDMMRPPKRMHAALISRLKILGELNIAERRLPQDGRIKITVGARQIDIRLSIVPAVFGERAVMRLLDKGTALLGLEELGMGADVLTKFRKIISLPHGIVLATGPTGSGKSTSLYASLQEIWSPATNILTIEDPVEYQVPGISQIQVRPNIGLTFASGLRSFLRQDPDVIMVGEIRDHETAEIAIHASLTGHLVFSTLHTNDAAGAVTRLLDMGVEPYLVASSLVGVVAQRLVRRVCSNCSEPAAHKPDLLAAIGLTGHEPNANFRRGRGCEKCQGTGYKGRQGLYELLVVDETIKRMTIDRASSSAMKAHAIETQEMRTLLGDGRLMVLNGKTTPEEVLRVSQREDF
ncbi:Type IV fimbrial assembly, ATPase PilB [Fimbriimonas ginsengisoli Gsoil 348]|uniref:protein-secreting ATPase n=2 Tax=Fimbriimonas ginsengisoli TaxID=1005039 RepID=A0A068NYX1_FIMGI|nr:Type IV fimbrial assembly, ATPase PilB [Fimbriimonas ginsengisoli Gsoil 348]